MFAKGKSLLWWLGHLLKSLIELDPVFSAPIAGCATRRYSPGPIQQPR
jgi:hypothetical protein